MLIENTANKRILVIISERIGDAIFCTPAINLLKVGLPAVTIDILTLSPYSAQVFEFNPIINEILIAPKKAIIKQLNHRYEVVIDLHNSEATRQYVKWLNKPAYLSPRSGDIHQSMIATNFIKTIFNLTETQATDFYQLYPQPIHDLTIQKLLKENGATFTANEKLIGCHIGNFKTAERAKVFWKRNIYSKKTWPIEKFAELQQALYQIHPEIKLVLTGQASEAKLIKHLHADLNNTINLLGKTSVLELAALMRHLKLFLTGCTGPLHVAAATEVPIVALFGPTFPEKTGPYPRRPQHIILQNNPLCMLPATQVKDALLKFL